MYLASIPNNPINKLILNDIGAVIPKNPLIRINDYLNDNKKFQKFEEAIEYVKTIYKVKFFVN